MITYELAKKLKDAGFPQIGESKTYLPAFTSDVYIPTLPELIEACGDKLDVLRNELKGTWSCGWYDTSDGGGFEEESRGSSPEEAVANLWLELNKKEW